MITPKLRFKNFNISWKEDVIENHFEFKNGLNKEKEHFGKGIPIINFTDVFHKSRLKREDIKGLVTLNQKEIERFLVAKGDVFFTRTSETIDEIGMASVLLENIPNCVFSGFVLRARPTKATLVDEFKQYCFRTPQVRKEITTKSSYTTRALTSGTLLNKVVIRFPESKDEQKKIASFLSAVDEKVRQLKRKQELLEQYKKGVMQQLFSRKIRFKDEKAKEFPEWEEKKYRDIITIKSEKHDPSSNNVNLKCIELEHLSSGTAQLLGFTNSDGLASIKNKFQKGEVLFGKLRPYLRKFLLAPFDGVCSSEIWVMNGTGLENEFLFHLIQTEQFLQLANQSSGSKMPRADWSVIKVATVQIPVRKEQQKIAVFLSSLDNQIEATASQISHTQTFKKGLLQQMFV